VVEVAKRHPERHDHFSDLRGALKERAHRTADDDVVVDGKGEEIQQRHDVSAVDERLAEQVRARLGVAVDDRYQRDVVEQRAEADQQVRQAEAHHDSEVRVEARASIAPADRQQRSAVQRQDHRRQHVRDRPRNPVKISSHFHHEFRYVPSPGFVVDLQQVFPEILVGDIFHYSRCRFLSSNRQTSRSRTTVTRLRALQLCPWRAVDIRSDGHCIWR